MTLIASKFGVDLNENDGVYTVTHGEKELVRTRVESLAKVIWEDEMHEADPARERRERERAYYDMQRARSDSFARRAANARKSGGKGGRGGV